MEETTNFIHEIIDKDFAEGRETSVHTRFPPEPNGYLHIGSAKAIWINAGTAQKYGGLFNLRFDDTNPVKEDDEYVRAIEEDLRWLGAEPNGGIFYGSDSGADQGIPGNADRARKRKSLPEPFCGGEPRFI